jgi:hypothetical protein
MVKRRIVAFVVAVVAVLGLGGVALANGLPARPSAAGPTITTVAGSGADPKTKHGRGEELRICAKAKVDAGATKADALKACLGELGLPADAPKGPKGPRGPKDGKGRPGLGKLANATHGELVVPKDGGGFETVAFDRGAITAVEAGSLTLKRADGPSVTVKLVDTTTFQGRAKSAADLKAGDEADVLSAGGVARLVHARKA